MPLVRRWTHESLPAALRWQAVSFIRTVWPDVDQGLLRAPYPPQVQPVYYTVTRDSDLLLSMAATYTTTVTVAGRPLTAACLGNVFTFPAARGAGLGRLVVDAAGDDIRNSAADVGALLCGPDLQPFYESSGWLPVPDAPTVLDGGETLASLRMMLIVSETAAGYAWETEPLHVPSAW